MMTRSSKTKILLVILAVIAVVAVTVGATLAFFTDSKESTGVFTAGNVYISLTEAAVKPDSHGNLIEDVDTERFSAADTTEGGAASIRNYGIVFPGQTIHKDPTIENVGDGNAWVAAKVIIEDGGGDIHRLYGYSDGYDDIDIERLLAGGLLDEDVHVGEWNGIPDVCYNDKYAMIQSSNRAMGKYEFYFLMLDPFKSGDSVEIFDTFYVDPLFGNNEMMEFRDLKITVQAFAAQEFGFSSCLEAMERCFNSQFISTVGSN